MKKLYLSLMALTFSLFLSEKGYSIQMFEECVSPTARGCTCGKGANRGTTIRFNDPLCKDEVGKPNACLCDYKD